MNAFKHVLLSGIAGAALMALAGAASAQDVDDYSSPPSPQTSDSHTFTYSFNIAGTSDYVFRGISQTDNDPTVQGGFDVTYGIFYAGGWASGLDFGGPPPAGVGLDAQVEIDWYGGIKPTWNSPFGPMDLDLGVIYYTYPGADDQLGELNYVEFKGGYSWSPLHPKLTTGAIVYFSPDYFGSIGNVWTIESVAAFEFHKVWVFLPVLNGVVGWQKGDSAKGYALNANLADPDDEYYYWNAGLNLAVENISFDFRYWDTNIGGDASGPLCGTKHLCDERFVFTGKVALP